MVNAELYICTCHQLAPGVGPSGNQGKNDGFSRGWVGLSALIEGKIQDVILGDEVVGKLKFCKLLEGNYANIMGI